MEDLIRMRAANNFYHYWIDTTEELSKVYVGYSEEDIRACIDSTADPYIKEKVSYSGTGDNFIVTYYGDTNLILDVMTRRDRIQKQNKELSSRIHKKSFTRKLAYLFSAFGIIVLLHTLSQFLGNLL